MKFDAKYVKPPMSFYPPHLEVEFAEVNWSGRYYDCDACKTPTGWVIKDDHYIHVCSEECLEQSLAGTIASRLFSFVGQEVQAVIEQVKETVVEAVEDLGSEKLLRYLLDRDNKKGAHHEPEAGRERDAGAASSGSVEGQGEHGGGQANPPQVHLGGAEGP